jgi:uncharacterized radical SAM superfamily protein
MKLSSNSNNYEVALSGDICSIGCKHYRASKLLESLKAIVEQGLDRHDILNKGIDQVIHGKNNISIEDAKQVIKFLADNGVK